MGHGGGEGRVPSLMAAAVEREAPSSYLFSFFFDESPMGHLYTKRSWRTRRLVTRMLVIYCHREVRSFRFGQLKGSMVLSWFITMKNFPECHQSLAST
jgi:hypothetical protein